MAAQFPDDSMFDHFTVFEETYKTVESHEIKAAVLIPNNASPGLHPVIINVHGGFLIGAHSLFAPFFAPWVLKLALEQSAVVISADYRLLPSANDVADLLEDLEDFWKWSRSDLISILKRRAPGHDMNLSKVLLTGSSAGGYAVMQMGLSHPDEVSAIATAYPFVDPADDVMVHGPKPDAPTPLRFPREDIPSKEEVEAWIEEAKKTITTKTGLERTKYGVGSTQHGLLYSKIFDTKNSNNVDFYPLKRLQAGARLPKKVWIIHGDDDSVVYLRTSQKFVNLVRQNLPETEIRLDIAHGEDHAFDLIKTSWELHAIGALEFVTKSWLQV